MPGFRQNVDCLLWEDRGRCMERQDYSDRTVVCSEINPYCILADMLKNIWVVGLLIIAAVRGSNRSCKAIYQPQYTSRAALVVGARDSTDSAFSNLQTATEMADAFREI